MGRDVNSWSRGPRADESALRQPGRTRLLIIVLQIKHKPGASLFTDPVGSL